MEVMTHDLDLRLIHSAPQACTVDGTTYEITNILPYIRKFHKHPVSGEPLGVKDIVPLRFHKNTEGQFCCPVLSKVFTAHTHIVAIKTSGNVFCFVVTFTRTPPPPPPSCFNPG